MEINKTTDGDTTILSLSGRLDTMTAPQLQEALAEVMPMAAITELDFTEIDYVSSAGLRVLLLGEKGAKASGKKMKLKNVSRDIMEVFEMTGFASILSVE